MSFRSKFIQEDLDMEMMKIGISITTFNIASFTYPEEIQKMVTKAASQSVVGDMGRYQQMAMIDAMANGNGGGRAASDMAGMAMGMMMGQQMVNQMQNAMQGQNNQNIAQGQVQNTASNVQPQPQAEQPAGGVPNFCPNCGQKTEGSKFCPNCGQKLVP